MNKFCKPTKTSGSTVSRHIYIAGLGEQIGTSKEHVRELFSQFGALDYSVGNEDDNQEVRDTDPVQFVEGKRYCFVSYVLESSAVQAVSYYKRSADDRDNNDTKQKLLVMFAAVNEVKNATDPLPPCTSSSDNVVIPGLRIVSDFIDVDNEQILLSSDMCSRTSSNWEELLSRRIQHFGLIFNYRTLMLDYATPIRPIPHIITESVLPPSSRV